MAREKQLQLKVSSLCFAFKRVTTNFAFFFQKITFNTLYQLGSLEEQRSFTAFTVKAESIKRSTIKN